MGERATLGAVHTALSHLVFAVRETLAPLAVSVRAQWQDGPYLSVEVECRARDRQQVVDRLAHGALVHDYDYRFSLSYPTGDLDPNAWVTVTAYPDLQHEAARRPA